VTDINRTRGDTWSVVANVQKNGVALDISGCSFVLTASDHENPNDGYTPAFSIVGTITDAVAGKVEFEWTATEADYETTLWYDVKMIDAASKIFTLGKGRIIYKAKIWT
jgi:hypothetical protein